MPKNNLWIRLFVILIFSSRFLCANHQIAVCAMFQDEGAYLKEWIEFHRLVGVEHFYLYNNCSNDDFSEILQPYCDKGIVTLINWPFFRSGNWDDVQVAAYNNCLELVKNQVSWLAIIDIDEFIVPIGCDTLTEFLKPYKAYAGIEIAWQDFGTSFVNEVPDGKTMLETLIYKAPKDSLMNGNHKTICRPNCIEKLGIHEHIYLPKALLGKTKPFSKSDADPRGIDVVRIQHYYSRTENYFREKKVPRLKRNENWGYTPEIADWVHKELNSEIDTTVLRFIPELKKRLGY